MEQRYIFYCTFAVEASPALAYKSAPANASSSIKNERMTKVQLAEACKGILHYANNIELEVFTQNGSARRYKSLLPSFLHSR